MSLPLWIADQVRNDGCHTLLRPVDSRLRGNDGEGRSGVYCLVTLTFDSSPIKGEGDSVGWFVLLLPHTSTAPLDCGSSPQ